MSEPTDPLPTLVYDGRRLSYEDLPGDPGRAPLLFLHEGLGSVGLWRGFHHRVAAATSRRTVAYSRFGHGRSDPPTTPRRPDFMHREAAETLPALRAALGLDEVILVGHSDGASIALLHAPAAGVLGAVLLAPHVFVEELGLRAIRAARTAFVEDGLRERMARHHDDPDTAFHNWNDVWLCDAFRSWDLRPQLGSIACPVLGIQGEQDPYGTAAHVQAVRDAVAGPADLLLLPGGHAPHLEHADQVRDAIAQFVRRLG